MRRYELLTNTEIQQYRQRTQKAINGIDCLLSNISIVSSKKGITEKYRTIAQYLGLIEDGVSHYNYFIPLSHDIVIMLRLSNHNNENVELYNLHEQKGRPDIRYVIIFQGDSYSLLSSSVFCEAKHYVYNYPTNGLDNDEDIKQFLICLKDIFTIGTTQFRGIREEPRCSNDDIIAQWNRSIDKNTNESKTRKVMNTNKIRLNESQLKQIIKESIYKTLYSLTEGKKINNRVPNPLDDVDYIDDETGEYEFLKRDKFADEYNSPEAKMKRNQRTTIRDEYRGKRLWFDFTLTDKSYDANLSYLKNRSEEEWLEDGRGFGTVQWSGEPYTAGNAHRVAVNGLVEMWNIDGAYFFIVRKGKENLFLN